MDNLLQNLLKALELSPSNVPLRMQVASMYMEKEDYEEAADHYSEVLNQEQGNKDAQRALAICFSKTDRMNAAIVIFEHLLPELLPHEKIIYIKCLIADGSIKQAKEQYQNLIASFPESRDPELDARFRNTASSIMPDFEYIVDDDDSDEEESQEDNSYFMEKPPIRFSDVGGMQRVKEEISMKIIQPIKNPGLFKAFGKKTGGGIMLYGPPGCGKTFIARATAGEINAKFINIGLHDILDMWMGNSEKNLHEIFATARRNAPCVLFFDEVDALGASRSDLKHSSMRQVINQFLSEMDGVESDNEGVLILAATNAPWSVDPAFRRPGRFDRIIFVEPPDEAARIEILQSILKDKPVDDIDYKKVAAATADYSGADLKAVVDIASEEKLRESISKGSIQNIQTKDLVKSAKQHRPTTSEWFASARNYALYANESGLYDDILKYLRIKK